MFEMGQTWFTGFLVNQAKDRFLSYQVSVTKTGETRILDTIKLLPTKYKTPKTSSADRINTAFEEIEEALNTPKLCEGFLNGNKEKKIISELVDILDKQRLNKKEQDLIVESSHKKSESHICA